MSAILKGDGCPASHGPSPCVVGKEEVEDERLARAANDRGPRRRNLEEQIDLAEEVPGDRSLSASRRAWNSQSSMSKLHAVPQPPYGRRRCACAPLKLPLRLLCSWLNAT
eukprot:8306399-Alexandrium_andersonii.AAC.1